jgi:hypothetical protein
MDSVISKVMYFVNGTIDDDTATDDEVHLDQGFCQDLFGHMLILTSEWEIFAVAELIVFLIMMLWFRHLQDISSEVMYIIQESKVIFPIHKKLLIAFALLSLFQSVIVIVFTHYEKVTGFDITSVVVFIFAWMFGLSAGLNGLVSGTTHFDCVMIVYVSFNVSHLLKSPPLSSHLPSPNCFKQHKQREARYCFYQQESENGQ